ncbi:PEGA domain-containing protein, partial [bacterium]|nr:PEGA domain-containing protein [bacterium]
MYSPEGTITGTYTTIQEGVNACLTGGTVSASAGTYTEVVYINKQIALVGVGTPTIDASGLGDTNVVTFDGASTNNALISGFKLYGATGGWPNSGMGIRCYSSSPIILNNIIIGNTYGIFCYSSSPTILNNIIIGNYHGIFCYSSSLTILNNTILENYYGISCFESSSPTILNNTISENGYGIYCWKNSSPSITNNTILLNYYGIICYSSSSPTIYNCIITNNNYYGIYCDGVGHPSIDYSDLYSNTLGNYYNCSVGPNCIYSNPQFIGGGDFHLGSSSPCIDAGSNDVPGLPSTDKDGNSRIVNGTVDMGAYEYQGYVPDVWINKYGPHKIAPGEKIIYRIYYGNSGNKKAKETTIVDTLPDYVSYLSNTSGILPSIVGQEITWDIGTLAPFTYNYFELRGTVSDAAPEQLQLLNTIEISSPDDSASYNNIATCITKVVGTYPDLSVCKWATNDALDRVFRAGDPIFYHIWYYNSGSKKAENVHIADYLPAQVTYSTSTGGIYSIPLHTVTWNIVEVAPGGYGYIKITGMIGVGVSGSFDNKVVIYSTTPESAYYNNTATTVVTIGAAYDPNAKEVDKDTIRAGEATDLQYTIHFENIGDVDARDVRVLDRLDNNLNWSSLVVLRQPALGPAGTFTLNETTGEAYWHFDEIYLATETTDFIIFSIKTKGGLMHGDEIPNAADIGFDDEPTMTTPDVYVMVSAYGTLNVTSSPGGANVFINGTDTGTTTPAELSLQVGSYTLTLTLPNYYSCTASFVINPDTFTYVSAILTPLPGTLSITSSPNGASIFLDGTIQGTTPATLGNITSGTHTLKLTLSGYYDWTDSITVTAGTTTPVFATLTLITGTIITVLDTTVVQNQIGTLTANLSKTGGNPISGKVLTFWIDNIQVGTSLTNAYGTATISRKCLFPTGTYTITVTFSGDSQYEPSTGTGVLYVKPPSLLPDLIITKINISPNRPIFEGDRINVVAWIKNIGSAIAEDIEVRFLDGTETKGTRT